ncbi:MAG: SDR family oxidoreductase [Cyanobacteria bacterium P01_G01_bin.67]
MSLQISQSIALVTGANRGIGRAFVEALHQAGAKKIYATARNIESLQEVVAIDPNRIIPLTLDVTNPVQIEAAAKQAVDINLLINNAGIVTTGGLFTNVAVENSQLEMDINYFGTLNMTRAFAPILKRNGGGAIANLASLSSHVNVPVFATYSASKAAVHSLTQATRAELASQNTLVIGLYPGPVETRMTSDLPLDKIATSQVAETLLAAIEQGTEDIYPDPLASNVLSSVAKELKEIEKQFAGMLPE